MSEQTERLLPQGLPLEEVVGQAIGAASACWENLAGAGTFESGRAAQIMNELLEEIRGRESEGLRGALAKALNSVSAENGSDTPDFILATYLSGCLAAFDEATRQRDRWWSHPPKWQAVEVPEAAEPKPVREQLFYAFGHLVASFNPEDPHHADSGDLARETLTELGLTEGDVAIIDGLAEHVAGNYRYTGEQEAATEAIKEEEQS
jgi:hypothetical protein